MPLDELGLTLYYEFMEPKNIKCRFGEMEFEVMQIHISLEDVSTKFRIFFPCKLNDMLYNVVELYRSAIKSIEDENITEVQLSELNKLSSYHSIDLDMRYIKFLGNILSIYKYIDMAKDRLNTREFKLGYLNEITKAKFHPSLQTLSDYQPSLKGKDPIDMLSILIPNTEEQLNELLKDAIFKKDTHETINDKQEKNILTLMTLAEQIYSIISNAEEERDLLTHYDFVKTYPDKFKTGSHISEEEHEKLFYEYCENKSKTTNFFNKVDKIVAEIPEKIKLFYTEMLESEKVLENMSARTRITELLNEFDYDKYKTLIEDLIHTGLFKDSNKKMSDMLSSKNENDINENLRYFLNKTIKRSRLYELIKKWSEELYFEVMHYQFREIYKNIYPELSIIERRFFKLAWFKQRFFSNRIFLIDKSFVLKNFYFSMPENIQLYILLDKVCKIKKNQGYIIA